ALPHSVLLRRRLLVLDRYAEAFSQPFDRAGEVESLGLADEGDHVALASATEAVVELVDRIDRERRCALVVERTAPCVAVAGLAQLRSRRDDLDEVRGRLDGFDGCVLDPGH